MEALTFGVDVVKLFPGSLLGPGFIKDVKGPIPHVELCHRVELVSITLING